ncbi:MAG: M15 family metallopeptidase [Aquiluna sp.]|nr:M15 family metallopeptidase [Aquiluna sp.]MCF8545640.1 M15 family metallopeptidase [Aquiluna sp.]
MRKSTPLRRNPIFVFGPPVVLFALGISLVSQPDAFGQKHEIILAQIEANKEAGHIPPTPEIDEYLYPLFATEHAGNEYVVVNKQRPLNPIDYAPASLREINSSKSLDNSRGLVLADNAATAIEAMAVDLTAAGLGPLFINSAYRSYGYQSDLFESKTEQYGLEGALIRSAKAGHSEHQTGLAVDVSVTSQGCAIMQCFGGTAAGIWIAENAHKYGLIVRYEEDTTSTTGYTYEPWHLRYVGKEVASLYAERGIHTLEDFWKLPAAEFYLEEITESTND